MPGKVDPIRRCPDVEAWPARIAAVTLEQVHAAAQFVFRPEQSVTAQLLPAEG